MVLPARVHEALDAFATTMRCPICLEALENPYSLPCNHCFCEPCITTALGFAATCPVCKAPARKRTLRHDASVQRIQKALQALLSMCPEPEALPRRAVLAATPAKKPPEKPDKPAECIDLCEDSESTVTQATQIEPLVPVQATLHAVADAAGYTPGQVVQVSARTWPGINKLGGTGWIVGRNDDGTYNVKYVLGGKENHIDPMYISVEAESNSSPTATPARSAASRKRASPSPHVGRPDETSQSRSKKKAPAATPREALVFLCSGLNHDEKILVEACATMVGATTVHEWGAAVTHVIVKCQHAAPTRLKLQISDKVKRWVKIRSIKYLKAVVAGRWIVSEAWIRACLKASALVSEETYEVQGLLKVQHVPEVAKKARLLRQANLTLATCSPSAVGTRLFSTLVCTVYGNFASPLPPKNEIGSLVRLGDGVVMSTLEELVTAAQARPSATYVVIVETMDVVLPLPMAAAGLTIHAVGYEWVLDSVSECAVKPLTHLLQTVFEESQRIIFSLASNDGDRRNLTAAIAAGTRGIYVGTPDDSSQLAKAKKSIADAVARGTLRREELSIMVECGPSWTVTALQDKCKDTITKLGVGYLDVVLLPAKLLPPLDTRLFVDDLVRWWGQMVQLLQAGIARHIGVSDFPTVFVEVLLQRFPNDRIEVHALPCHPLLPQRHAVRFAHSKQIDVVARFSVELSDSIAYEDREQWLRVAANIAQSHSFLTFKHTLPSETVQADTAVVTVPPPVETTVVMHPVKTPCQVLAKWLLQRGLVGIPVVEGDDAYTEELCTSLFALTHPFVHEVAGAAPSRPYQFILTPSEMQLISSLGPKD
ncbi:hypothetical protein ACHHYP_07214 [Achlya hypogyna]|uniref:RING-type E3 ubiquitin transferase BRCA1 n=1 Tax=Achlya hypogyna TaxID=1202772 RepID=A0A1V9ZMG6_ACHHY|nr:hypothetical protein ACHHYP_07214 [Achlya hypogyna]